MSWRNGQKKVKSDMLFLISIKTVLVIKMNSLESSTNLARR